MRALALLLLVALVTPAATPTWSWPVSGPRVVTRPYLAPATPYGPGHRGVDLAAAGTAAPGNAASGTEVPGTVVTAPADGIVHFSGVVVDRPVLSIEHAGGFLSSYEPVTSTLSKGDAVARGDPIGTLEPGHCTTPCLHLGVRLNGEYVSPLLLLGGVPRAVLLPTRRLSG